MVKKQQRELLMCEGVCVDTRTNSACDAGETCTNNRCLPTDLCEEFENVTGSVVFRLDRKAPTAEINSAVLENALNACTENPGPIANNLVVSDDQTPQPTVAALPNEVEDCTVRRIVRVSDDCGDGNIQDIVIETSKPVEAGQLSVDVTAYRCQPGENCITEGPDAQVIADNQRVPSAAIVVDIDSGRGCALNSSTTLINQDHFNGACPEPVTEPVGNGFCAQCDADDDCGPGAACFEGACVDLNKGAGACGPGLQECAANSECVDGVCLVGQPECVDAAQCGAGNACVRGICVIDPASDLACNNGEICRRGSCVDVSADRACNAQTPCPNNGACGADGRCAECADDAECAGEQVCIQGSCYEPERCTANIDCIGSRHCSDGQCQSPCQIYTGDPVTTAGTYSVQARRGLWQWGECQR